MNVCYIIAPTAMLSGRSNGVRQQALTWKAAIEELGCSVRLASPWDDVDWRKFDIIHIFQFGLWLGGFLEALVRKNPRVVLSPIIDTTASPATYRVAASLIIPSLRIGTDTAFASRAAKLCRLILARSRHESAIITQGLGITAERVETVHIPVRSFQWDEIGLARETVCLHTSSYYQPRKNVARLIEACGRVGLPLWLAGNPGQGMERRHIEPALQRNANVREFGFMSDSELFRLMSRAKVFALPSLNEGVGLAALEAGICGCEIVVTKHGGPPDYFGGFAQYVVPESISSIATGLLGALEKRSQPALRAELCKRFSSAASGARLLRAYQRVLTS